MSPTDIALFTLLGVLIASNTAVFIHLSQRIDRMGERISELTTRVTELAGLLDRRMDRLDAALREHSAAHAGVAHGR